MKLLQSFQVRFLALISSLIIIVVLCLSFYSIKKMTRISSSVYQNQATQVVRAAQGIVDGDSFERYAASLDPNDLRVLIVDDDSIALEHARMVLEEVGIAADVCSSAEEALSFIEINHAKQTPYNLVLVDRTMRNAARAGHLIAGGSVRINPYEYKQETACAYCPYRSVCGFDEKIPGYGYRKIMEMDQETLFLKMEEESDELDH